MEIFKELIYILDINKKEIMARPWWYWALPPKAREAYDRRNREPPSTPPPRGTDPPPSAPPPRGTDPPPGGKYDDAGDFIRENMTVLIVVGVLISLLVIIKRLKKKQ